MEGNPHQADAAAPPEPNESGAEKITAPPLLSRWRRWRYPTGALVLALGLKFAAVKFPGAVESVYSRGFYPRIVWLQTLVTRWFGFSLAELLIVAAILAAVVYLTRNLWLAIRKRRGWKQTLGRIAFAAFSFVAWGLLLFFVIWGLNYDRRSVAVNLDLPRRDVTDDELAAISRHVVAEINQNYAEANAAVAADGGTILPMDRPALERLLGETYRQQAANLLVPGFSLGPAKPVFFSGALTRMGITGVYNPFTAEPNFNTQEHPVELPFTIAHEMAHQRGFAREDEANFIAFLVCTHSDNAYIRYSGYFNARSVLRVLARTDLKLAREIAAEIAPGPIADEQAVRNFWRSHLGQTSNAANYLNDKYLKANRIANGTGNYLDSNALVIGYYLKVGW